MKQKISNCKLHHHFANTILEKTFNKRNVGKIIILFRLLNKIDSKNSKRIDNLNNSVKNSLKNLKIFFKKSAYFQFGFYVYLILIKVVMKLSSIYF